MISAKVYETEDEGITTRNSSNSKYMSSGVDEYVFQVLFVTAVPKSSQFAELGPNTADVDFYKLGGASITPGHLLS